MGVAGFGVENRRRPFLWGEAFYGEAYKCYLQFYSKCDTLLSSIPICEAVDTFQKRNGTEIIECSGDAGSGEKRC